ncbi:aldose 1-epimerase [Phenylobacterium deserti]|uniref:Aldose 1-epimerase n=1 Tax=Phenylobacterium deserti TaxID=1914756 RepID=A0A328AEB9_9CAUL|nr:aldose 1-epimerase [Phenylobacterium deserti]RAK52827.1 aldose 1-epimerase [Phenylobacterium deserti]
MAELLIGGMPAVTLRASDAPAEGPAILEAVVLPGRGMMLLQAKVRLPSGELFELIHAPPLAEAPGQLDGGPDDFAGNKAFTFGGAILVPYANRITGRNLEGSRETEAEVDGRTVRLLRNWGGKAPGAAQYSMHGLILDAQIPFEQPSEDVVRGRLQAGSFGGRWPSETELEFEWRLAGGVLSLRIDAHNRGDEVLPMGIGWHPYLNLPSQDRRQARLRLPAAKRAEVNDYDEVLPTGRLLDTVGSPYDFNAPQGAALADLYLDDCFTELERTGGEAVVEVLDPAAGVGFRATSPSPEVHAIQVYAPTDKAFVVVEPQFNLADPYSPLYPQGTQTGMTRVAPGGSVTYEARLEAFALGT